MSSKSTVKASPPARRVFLISAGLLIGTVAGGLAIGAGFVQNRLAKQSRYRLPSDFPPKPVSLGTQPTINSPSANFGLNTWITIDSKGLVTVAVPNQEMGQGIASTIAMLAAEELDLLPSQVQASDAPIHGVYANVTMLLDGLPFAPSDQGLTRTGVTWTVEKILRALGVQATGGSTSLRNSYAAVRQAAASARFALLSAAATILNVPRAQLSIIDGIITHAASSKKLSFGEVAAAASALEVSRASVKAPNQWRYIGRGMPRLDIPAKLNGSLEFGIDVRRLNQVYAAIRHAPVFGSSLISAGFKADILGKLGVRKLVQQPGFIAVIADSWWQAQQAVSQASPQWTVGTINAVNDGSIFAEQLKALDSGLGTSVESRGDVSAVLPRAAKQLQAAYQVPYLAHATMEPMNCTVLYKSDSCEIWSGNQAPTLVKWLGAQAANLPSDAIIVHTMPMGGGFGRRSEMDVIREAITIAKSMPGVPVQTIWSREEDMQHDFYRPSVSSRFTAGLDQTGKLVAWRHQIAGPSVTTQFTERIGPAYKARGPDKTNAEGATWLPYAIANLEVQHALVESAVPIGFWRSVGHSFNAFFVESFLDECAHAASQDPLAFRINLLQANAALESGETASRFRVVLEMLALKSNWAGILPKGPGKRVGRGLAIAESFHSIVAQAVEVEVDDKQSIVVKRVVCVVDCGLAVDPVNSAAQVRGAVLFAMAAALHGRIQIEAGKAKQSNFTDYPMVKLADAPTVEVYFVDSGAAIGGIGEVGVPPFAPALGNAIFAATGKRLRHLPFDLLA